MELNAIIHVGLGICLNRDKSFINNDLCKSHIQPISIFLLFWAFYLAFFQKDKGTTKVFHNIIEK